MGKFNIRKEKIPCYLHLLPLLGSFDYHFMAHLVSLILVTLKPVACYLKQILFIC